MHSAQHISQLQTLLSDCSLLSDNDLNEFLLEALIIYGSSQREGVSEIVYPAYAAAMERLPAQTRLETLFSLTNAIIEKKTSNGSLFPLIFLETDDAIVGSAALRFIHFSLPPDGDELYDAVFLAQRIHKARNPGAIFAGMLALADRRFLGVLASVTATLRSDELEYAATVSTSPPSVTAFEVWLIALETTARSLRDVTDPEAIHSLQERFTLVCHALLALKTKNETQYFYDVRRHLGYLYKSPAEEPSTILGKFEPDTVANYFSDRLTALINIEKRYPASLPYLLSVYGVQTLSYTEREIADSGTATDRKSCFSYVSVVDHTLPYADRVEQILELVKSQTVPVLEASSLYFPTLADAYKKLDADGIRVFGEQTASTIERFQTWFALTEPEPGGLSKTGILVQNFSEHTLKGFVIKYVDGKRPVNYAVWSV